MSVLEVHRAWFWVAVVAAGLVGLWGLTMAVLRREPGRAFSLARAAAISAVLLEVGLGLILYAQGRRPGSIHVFYGFVILFTFAFAYIYRPTMAQRPALAYGLLMLFVMGLGIRAMSAVP